MKWKSKTFMVFWIDIDMSYINLNLNFIIFYSSIADDDDKCGLGAGIYSLAELFACANNCLMIFAFEECLGTNQANVWVYNHVFVADVALNLIYSSCSCLRFEYVLIVIFKNLLTFQSLYSTQSQWRKYSNKVFDVKLTFNNSEVMSYVFINFLF